MQAASVYKNTKIAVHNFASATNPGGGVKKDLMHKKNF
ncbi:poly(ADP-ribose) glycohydrolase domain-containing protein [Anaerostipes hadrus]|nr:poly(ADP-ribose) glycohydrolase domain-containing protein [Anaerostipes hadrus]